MRTVTRHLAQAAVTGTAAALLLGLGAPGAAADSDPAAPVAPSAASRSAAHEAATAPEALGTVSRFFAREGAVSEGGVSEGGVSEGGASEDAVSKAAAAPRVQGGAVPVYHLSPEFVAGEKGAPIARLEFLASEAVASDGRKASLWTVERGDRWEVVNIASGDDETRYARVGADKLPGGTVFREPQIDAWYVQRGQRVLPLDKDAVRAIGTRGTTLAAYQKRVAKAYGDKLPGSGYAKSGKAGGYAPQPPAPATAANATDPAVTVATTAAGLGAAAVLALATARALRARRN
ncbi:hypothetical protein [Streptomyces apocyni]|uniref:hypothetical protein n=1 Tax=Streptomyces apocyni TaxID=2654677 RepID=UPI0012EA0EC4|nr:hypothetical protein [Streptomyces apocyni]